MARPPYREKGQEVHQVPHKRKDIVPVLIAGGVGTRFWPLSTPRLPKQFITAFGEKSLFRQTLERASALADVERTVVMTAEAFGPLVEAQGPELPRDHIILEPLRRDTAPAITLSAVLVENLWPESVMVVMPSDHRIRDIEGFKETIGVAAERARQGGLVTVGIPPTYPATVYGYLHVGTPPGSGPPVARLRRFVEKPQQAQAEEFIESGEFLWNSGIFVWRASTILEAVKEHLPDLYAAVHPLGEAVGTEGFQGLVRSAFERVAPISIDYGVMEKAREVWAVPAAFDWSDVGGWTAARELVPQTEAGNRVRGRVILNQSSGNLIISDREDHTVLCLGVEKLIVVTTKEGTLICHEDVAEKIKAHVEGIIEVEGQGSRGKL